MTGERKSELCRTQCHLNARVVHWSQFDEMTSFIGRNSGLRSKNSEAGGPGRRSGITRAEYVCFNHLEIFPQIALAIGVLTSNRRGGWLEKIDQSVTPFSAAPFSTLIIHKLACAVWGLCWYNSWGS